MTAPERKSGGGLRKVAEAHFGKPCPACSGSGHVSRRFMDLWVSPRCKRCGGTGRKR